MAPTSTVMGRVEGLFQCGDDNNNIGSFTFNQCEDTITSAGTSKKRIQILISDN